MMNVLNLPKDCFQAQVFGAFLLGKDVGMFGQASPKVNFLVTDFVHRNLKKILVKADASDQRIREALQSWVDKTVTEIVPGKVYESLPDNFLERYVRARARGEQLGRVKLISGANQEDLIRYFKEFSLRGFIYEASVALSEMDRDSIAKIRPKILKELLENDQIKEAIQVSDLFCFYNLFDASSGDLGKILRTIEAARLPSPLTERSPLVEEQIEDSLLVAKRLFLFAEGFSDALSGDVIFENLKKLTLAQVFVTDGNVLARNGLFPRFQLEQPLWGVFVLEVIRKSFLDDLFYAARGNGQNITVTEAERVASLKYPEADRNPIGLRLRERISTVKLRENEDEEEFSLLKVLDTVLIKLKEDGREEDIPIIESLQQLRSS